MAWTSYSIPLFAAPRVSVGETSYDFGIINQGQLVTSSFSVGSIGTEPLLIERIEFSMPGMNARVKQHIEPQEKTQINVTWDTSRFRREIMGQATLYLNDPAMPQIILSLSGTVIPDIEFLPRPAFYFSQFTGENHSQSITLKNNQDHPLELTVSVKPDAPAGRFRDSLVIKTNDPEHPNLVIAVTGIITD